jgi:uronate dehydrogenase
MLNPSASPLRFSRLLLTGAAGFLGRELRPRIKAYCDVLRLSDRADLGAPHPGEEVQLAALENKDQVLNLLDQVDAVVHLGGISTEQPWDCLLYTSPSPRD